MAIDYKIKITNNNGVQSIYNKNSNIIMNIELKRKSRIGIMEIEVDNTNGQFDDEFTEFNEIYYSISPDNVTTWGLSVPFEVPSTLSSQPKYFQRFGGEVIEVTPNEDNTSITLTCKDWNNLLAQQTITGTWTDIDLGQLIYNIISEKYSDFDVSQINTSTGVTIDRIQADAIYINDFLDDIFRENDYNLYVDSNKIVRLFDTNRGSSGIVLTTGNSGNLIDSTINLKKSNISRKNKITIIGGNEVIENFDESQFTWNTGDNLLIPLEHLVLEMKFVKFNGTEVSEGTDFELTEDKRFIKLKTISDGDTVDVRYNYNNPIWWSEQDPSASTIRELVVKDDTILTQSRAQAIATKFFNSLSLTKVKGSLSSDVIDKNFGWKETLQVSNVNGVNNDLEILGFTESLKKYYKVDFELSQVLDENTKKIVDLIKDVDKLKSSDSSTATLKDGFTISEILGLNDQEADGYERSIGDKWIFNHPTNSKMNDGKVMRNKLDYGTHYDFQTNLQAWWKFDNNTFEEIKGTEGVWSGTENYTTGLQHSKAASFDANSTIDLQTKVPEVTGEITLAFTEKSDGSGSNEGYFICDGTDLGNFFLRRWSSGTEVTGYFGDVSLNTITLPRDVWNIHIITHDSSGNFKWYINNVLKEDRTGAYFVGFTEGLIVGNNTSNSRAFKGAFGDLRVWNKVFDSTDIEEFTNDENGVIYINKDIPATETQWL